MDRRAYLGLVGAGAVSGLAGCASDTEEIDTGGEDTSTTRETSTTAATETTTTPAGEPDVVLEASALQAVDTRLINQKYVAGRLVNKGDGTSGTLVLSVRWYNEAGELLGDSSEYLPSLNPDEVWRARVYQPVNLDAENIADYELEGEFQKTPPQWPDDIELSDTSHTVSDDETSVTVSGAVANNTGDVLSYVEAHAKVYDSRGYVLDGMFANQENIPEGDTWRFNAEWLLYRADLVEGHEVILDVVENVL